MKIRIRILTPVHIGSGEDISPMEYLVDREKGLFHRLNMDSLFRDEKFQPYRERFIKEASHSRYIGQIVSDHSILKRHILYTLSISAEARQQILTNPTNVKAFIKSAGRVYIPGSSLKGSILSALLYYVIKENYPSLTDQQKSNIQEILKFRKKENRQDYESFLNIAFSWIAPHSRVEKKKFAPWLDISDSNLDSPESCLQISLARVRGALSKKELPILYESLKEDRVFEAEIKSRETPITEKKILEIVHNFYLRVARKDEVGHPIRNKWLSEQYLLRIGQGSTAFSTSLLLLSEELGLRYFVSPPRTRKRIGDYIPMGFVQLTLLEVTRD
ncbi:MAG: type III-A CRISPR-associated RAMP protein Csm5 [Candidatus Aminicenantes bacterium]|nr:type III-A CRISPR-associated RAMP protein Csm5 [Candidatus Aminicenantes bacterium]